MIDLHTHSNISDGDLHPAALIEKAVREGLHAIALTDHDTINGVEIAKAAAGEKIQFIPGIEINISWAAGNGVCGLGPGGEFHLLGLGIKNPSTRFTDAVKNLSGRREARGREMLDRMYELSMTSIGVGGEQSAEETWNELVTDSGSHSVGRPHFAHFLVKRKIVKNINQAFARYLGVGKPLYVPKVGMDFEEAVSVIRESGGIPVLAHPISLYVAWGHLPDLVKTLKDRGLMGLEAWHPTAKAGSCRRLETLANTLGLYVTEGSDFHGSIRKDRRLGYSSKGRKINDAVLKAIPELN